MYIVSNVKIEINENNIKEVISIDKKEANENKFTEDILEAVCNEAKVDIPEAMVENRLAQMVSQVENQAKAYGLTADQLLSFQGTSLEQYKEMMKPAASRYVLESVVLEAVKKAEKVKLKLLE